MGNYCLFMAGIFPKYIYNNRHALSMDHYEQTGIEGFGNASGHDHALTNGVKKTLEEIAEHFQEIRKTLNLYTQRVLVH